MRFEYGDQKGRIFLGRRFELRIRGVIIGFDVAKRVK